MDDERLFKKRGGGCIFESYDVCLKNTPASHTISLAVFVCTCSDSAMHFCHAIAYAITENGAGLHLLVHPLAMHCKTEKICPCEQCDIIGFMKVFLHCFQVLCKVS